MCYITKITWLGQSEHFALDITTMKILDIGY
jgi:hypothetical protein